MSKINDPKIQNQKWYIVNKNCVELRYEDNNDVSVEPDYISEITGVFTTANARVRLYTMLDWLHPSQLLYIDTDSVMFIYDKTNPLHKAPLNSESNPKLVKFGNGLGEWENEFKGDKDGNHIVELVVGGAKSYAYITDTGKIVIKMKGVTLDVANLKVVTFEAVKKMVLNAEKIDQEENGIKTKKRLKKMVLNGEKIEQEEDGIIKTKKRFNFRWLNNTKDVITKYIDKSLRSTVSEKRMINGFDTRPFGFSEN